MIDEIFSLSEDIRYVAIYRDGKIESRSKQETVGASSSESDFYEELLVNPTLIKLATQRGEINCGGLEYLIVLLSTSNKALFLSAAFEIQSK